MKRIYACIAIVAALLGLACYSSFQVRCQTFPQTLPISANVLNTFQRFPEAT